MYLKQNLYTWSIKCKRFNSSAVLSPKYLGSSLKKKQTIHPSEWFSFGYRLWLRQPEANATIGKHVGLLVAPVKSKDRAQAKVMTDYKEDQAAGNWATFEIIFSFQGTITYPLPVCTLESMIFRRSHGGICDRFREGIETLEIFGRILEKLTNKYHHSSIFRGESLSGLNRKKALCERCESGDHGIPTVWIWICNQLLVLLEGFLATKDNI